MFSSRKTFFQEMLSNLVEKREQTYSISILVDCVFVTFSLIFESLKVHIMFWPLM